MGRHTGYEDCHTSEEWTRQAEKCVCKFEVLIPEKSAVTSLSKIQKESKILSFLCTSEMSPAVQRLVLLYALFREGNRSMPIMTKNTVNYRLYTDPINVCMIICMTPRISQS